MYPEWWTCAAAPLSVALPVRQLEHGKLHLLPIFEEVFLVLRVLLVGEDLRLVDVVGRVSLVHELLVGEGVSVPAGVVLLSAPGTLQVRVSSPSRTL